MKTSCFGVEYRLRETGQSSLPPICLCVEIPGPARVQDYLTPQEALDLAMELQSAVRQYADAAVAA